MYTYKIHRKILIVTGQVIPNILKTLNFKLTEGERGREKKRGTEEEKVRKTKIRPKSLETIYAIYVAKNGESVFLLGSIIFYM